MNNPIMAMLMGQLKIKNPQMANQVQEMIKSNGNPMELFKQITSKYDDNTKNAFFNQAKQMGFSEELLNQVQSGINS